MNIELLRQEIIESDTQVIYQKYLMGNNVWYFREYLEEANYSDIYDEFKRYITTQLGIRFNEIAIFGSAKVGVSFSPTKQLRNFQDDSDIDLALVSREYFQMFWEEYLKMYYNGQIIQYNQYAKTIFKHFVDLKSFPDPQNEVYTEWNTKVLKFHKDLQFNFGIAHEVNYRIFESWESVERYYKRGIVELRNNLLGV